MLEYMERATALIHSTCRRTRADPETKDAGKMADAAPAAGKVRLEFQDFIQP